LAFFHNSFEAAQLADLSGTSLLESSLKIVTPKLKILEANYSYELEVDKRARLDLAKLANLTKQNGTSIPIFGAFNGRQLAGLLQWVL